MSYQALELNGSGYASIADGSQAGMKFGSSDFVIEIGVKTISGAAMGLVTKWGEGDEYAWRLYLSPDVYAFGINVAGTNAFSFSSSKIVNDGKYHYVVLVVDQSGTCYIYIDGSQEGSSAFSGTALRKVTAGILIGRVERGNTSFFTGMLDEFRIWNFGKDGLPSDYAAYITWRAEGRNIFVDISNYGSGAWNGYADADRTDLLTNGDMELDANWIARGTPTTEVRSSEQANNGTYSWKIVSDATSEGAYQDITTVVGKWYEVTGYVYVTAGDVKLGKEDTDGSDQVLTGQATAAAWNEFNVIFKATETTSRIFFQSDATAASTFYVDDMKVVRTGLVSRYKFSGNYNDETANANHLTAGGSGNTFPGYSLRSKAQKMLLGVG